jgi:hypothetical protein
MKREQFFQPLVALTIGILLCLSAAPTLAEPPAKTPPVANGGEKEKDLRTIRVAVFNIDIQGVDIQPENFRRQPDAVRPSVTRSHVGIDPSDALEEREWQIYERRLAELRANPARMSEIVANDASGQGALTDQVNVLLSAIDKVTIVNRDQMHRVADEHQIALSGLADTASAVKLGKFLSAQYIIVGRASKIGQVYYLVLKIIDVETTEQTTVSAKSPVEGGFPTVLTHISEPLLAAIRRLQRPVTEPEDTALAELRKLAKPLLGKTIIVSVEETHINRPLVDPAAQMAIMQRLRAIGLRVIVPKDPVNDWKETLLQSGKYGTKKVDFLLEGEGTSAYAGQLQGLTSCRARVELRWIALPGREITSGDKGVAAGVDLVEALAAKTALEEAGRQAADAVIRRFAKEAK